ncbi:MAG: hypothetical protein A2Y38_19115 [Spirochaetes bacterium GWB1_59_5]|nr:MAG: hypothetical protein A2Y38_19115 [Spirochaetes bacterium GWB1_59_5]
MPAIVKEGSTAYLTATFKDKTGALAAPSTLSYRIDCLTTGQVVRDDMLLTPADTVEITLTPADMAILTAGNSRETKRVTVKAGYGANDAVNDEYELIVKNLGGV